MGQLLYIFPANLQIYAVISPNDWTKFTCQLSNHVINHTRNACLRPLSMPLTMKIYAS